MSRNIVKGLPLLIQGQTGEVWRLLRGVMVVKRALEGESKVISLAMPGDFLGLEAAAGVPYTYTTFALTDAWVEQDRPASVELERTMLLNGLLQQQRQNEIMVHLRTGTIRERMALLLKLLAQSLDGHPMCHAGMELPTLRDFAQVLGTASETACRELNGFLLGKEDRESGSLPAWTNKLAKATHAIRLTH